MRARIVTLGFTGRAHNAAPHPLPSPHAISSQSQKDMYLFARPSKIPTRWFALYSSLNSLKRNQGVNFQVVQNSLN